MRNYIILNGNNSNEITGLLIQSLPPISKPLMRTTIEEIDGRDGDIVTNLGYSAYDKEMSIGLYGSYDVDAVIKYFSDNMTGQVTFSNEPDKYYNYEIINQIDFERLIRFKTAIVTFHVQPFKYPVNETPVEIAYQYINNKAEEMALDNTADAPMTLAPKGNIEQDSTTGKQYFNANNITNTNIVVEDNGKTIKMPVVSSGNGYVSTQSNLSALCPNLNVGDVVYLNFTRNLGTSYNNFIYFEAPASQSWDNGTSKTITQDMLDSRVVLYANRYGSGETAQVILTDFRLTKNEIDNWEPYTNGASPNPSYPQDIHIVSGDNTIDIVGENLLPQDKYIATTTKNGITYTNNGDGTFNLTGTANANTTIEIIPNGNIQLEANQPYYLYSSVPYNGTTFNMSIPMIDDGTTKFVLANNTYTPTATPTNVRLQFYIGNGQSINQTNIKLMLVKGSTSPTTYKPYIGNTYPLYLGVENLWKNQLTGFLPQSGAYPTTNSSYPSARYVLIPLITGQSITLSGSTSTMGRVRYIDKDTNQVVGTIDSGETAYYKSTSPFAVSFTEGTITANKEFIVGIMDMSGSINDLVVNYGTKPQTISDNPIEVGAIGEYEDEFFKNTTDSEYYDSTLELDKWYLKKRIGKVVLDGSENWKLQSINDYGIANFSAYINDYVGLNITSEHSKCDKFSPQDSSISATQTEGYLINSAKSIYIRIASSRANTVATFKAWLSNNNVDLYYVLATPTNILLNDTLQEQLDDLRNNTRSFEGRTHITQNANDKPFMLNATAIQSGSDTGNVDNQGNIYSKPTLDIEGSGTIGIYLNDNQMFSVDLSNSNECIIDVTNLEAYDPSTSQLMNRQVTGDYSKFTLPVGENEVKVSGNVTKATISGYTRWL